MAVITKYIVVRNGVELERTFLDKKEAEAYYSMLDAAESLASLIDQGNLSLNVEPKTIEEIAIYLAKNAPAVMKILKPVKPFKPTATDSKKAKSKAEPGEEQEQAKEPRTKAKSKTT